jgi:hypothetical protein
VVRLDQSTDPPETGGFIGRFLGANRLRGAFSGQELD